MSIINNFKVKSYLFNLILLFSLAHLFYCNSEKITEPKTGSLNGIVKNHTTQIALSGVIVNCAGIITTTTIDGKYLLQEIPTGRHPLVAEKTGYERFSQTISITSEMSSYDILLTQLTSSVNGSVKNKDTGAPIPGVKITIAGVVDYSDANGHYHLSSVPQGEQMIKAEEINYDEFTGTTFIPAEGKSYDIVMSWKLPHISTGSASLSYIGEITAYTDLFGVIKPWPSTLAKMPISKVTATASGVKDGKGIKSVELEYEALVTHYSIKNSTSTLTKKSAEYEMTRLALISEGDGKYSLTKELEKPTMQFASSGGYVSTGYAALWVYFGTNPKLIVTDVDDNTISLDLSWIR